MTFVKAKLKLEAIEPGDELEILLCDGEPIQNVPKSIEDNCGTILEVKRVGEHFLLKVIK